MAGRPGLTREILGSRGAGLNEQSDFEYAPKSVKMTDVKAE
jgi:hypothetical protein